MTASEPLSNSEIADRLLSLAQLLAAHKENPYKIKAYRRAARTIRSLGESVVEFVADGGDLTAFPGIGSGISSAVREIVASGALSKLNDLRSTAPPEFVAISEYPLLDPARVLRIYKRLKISTISELRGRLESGAIASKLGARMAHHVREAMTERHEMLLYHADDLAPRIESYLRERCGVKRTVLTGEVRRRMEVVTEVSCLIETNDFAAVIQKLERYGGRTELIRAEAQWALLRLASGVVLRVDCAQTTNWGAAMIASTGSPAHVQALELRALEAPTEEAAYRKLGLDYIEPELREGRDEIRLAAEQRLPTLVTRADIHGDLHAHTTSSDGSHSIEQMARGAMERGYEYVGITDHSQSLKIARGLPEPALWEQIRAIDQLNERLTGIRVLKSAEVDILADGSLDYSDDLLRELDYTVCSIHSRFGLDREAQTERLLRAMDNRYFTVLGHATGRLLLKRPGYEVDMDRVIRHAAARGCFFEINSSPDRLDLPADLARRAHEAGIKIAINTDAHSIPEYDLIQRGIDQARRAGLSRSDVLNCLPLTKLVSLFRR